MNDFKEYTLNELFKIRDALTILHQFDLADEDLMFEISEEIERRKK